MNKLNGLLTRIWNNGEFTEEANKSMIMISWVLSWIGIVIGATI
jgi:hypothetical protein